MRIVSLVVLLLLSPWCIAAGSFSVPVYASGFLDRQSIGLSGQKFQPVVASAALGGWLYEGIGVELELGTAIQDDNVAALRLEPESMMSLGLRFESAPINGVAAYALLAVSAVSIDTRFTSGTAAPDDRHFRGFRGVFGLTFPLVPRWVLDAAFVRQDYDDDFAISGVRLGVRYAINDIRPRPRQGWLR